MSPLHSTCLTVSADVMHQRLGHLHSAALRRFCTTGERSSGMCTSCIFAKSHRRPFQSSFPQADRLLYRIHSDVVGPLQTRTPHGNRYFVTFIDEYTRFAKVYLMKNKSEVFEHFKEFMMEAERLTGQQLCILKCDRGGEYGSARFHMNRDQSHTDFGIQIPTEFSSFGMSHSKNPPSHCVSR